MSTWIVTEDDEHPLGPARGCVYGVLIGAACWALLIWLAAN